MTHIKKRCGVCIRCELVTRIKGKCIIHNLDVDTRKVCEYFILDENWKDKKPTKDARVGNKIVMKPFNKDEAGLKLKRCAGPCLEIYPETEDYFYKNTSGRKGLKNICKLCYSDNGRKYREGKK